MARASGRRAPAALCALFASVTGDRLAVVDLVLWRYATLRPDYIAELRALKVVGIDIARPANHSNDVRLQAPEQSRRTPEVD